MKATLDQDIIAALHAGDTEIGELPPGVGIERLRWDGARLVDLDSLAGIWVEVVNGTYRLHAVAVPGAVLVPMTYRQRKMLMLNGGSPRLKTIAEATAEAEAEQARQAQDDLDRSQNERIGDLSQRVLRLYQLLFALLVWARTQDKTVEAFLNELVPLVKDIFPKDKIAEGIKADLVELKIIMDEHYASETIKIG